MRNIFDSIKDDITTIQDLKQRNKFKNYIEYMVFPYFKNLELNTKIELDFPMTILIGRNGCGKSSTLQAFYGAPKGYSCGEFWFSTNLDPIIESKDRNRYFYGYKENDSTEVKEVKKSRIKRSEGKGKKADPDYWETTRPSIKDGMKPLIKGSRNTPVNKKVVYIDFRGELSAFDKYFYFFRPQRGKKQDYLRNKSEYLSKIFNGEDPRYWQDKKKRRLFDELITFEEKYVSLANKILGKNYKEILMVDHRVYSDWGTSILVKTDFDSQYSEANAGSGETAVIKLVYRIMKAEPFSLILLDEPEVSLHPSAQLRLKKFLLEQIKNKKHQVIISTHSQVFSQDMPSKSIKLFETNQKGKFIVKNEVTPDEAFYDIGGYAENKKNIICEDVSCKILLEKVLLSMRLLQFFEVKYVHGGAETIVTKHLPVYAMNNEFKKNIYIILDGDKDSGIKYEINELMASQLECSATLEGLFAETTTANCKVSGFIDGCNGDGRDDQKVELYRSLIKYQCDNMYFLPNNSIPEAIILNNNDIKLVYGNILCNYNNEITNSNAKDIIKDICLELHGEYSEENYLSTMSILANKWCKEENEDFSDIKIILSSIHKSNK